MARLVRCASFIEGLWELSGRLSRSLSGRREVFIRLVKSHLVGRKARTLYDVGLERFEFALEFNYSHDPEGYLLAYGHGVRERMTLKQHYRQHFGAESSMPERLLVAVDSQFYLLSQHVFLVGLDPQQLKPALARIEDEETWPQIQFLYVALPRLLPCHRDLVDHILAFLLPADTDRLADLAARRGLAFSHVDRVFTLQARPPAPPPASHLDAWLDRGSVF